MNIRFVDNITEEELKELPSGTVISFGTFCWEKLGPWWMDFHKNEYRADELSAAVDEKRVAMEIRAFTSLYRDKYPYFSVITPHDEEAFGEIAWSEVDIENAFDILGYEITPEKKEAVLNKVRPIIDDKMIERGWDLIYNAVEEVCEDDND